MARGAALAFVVVTVGLLTVLGIRCATREDVLVAQATATPLRMLVIDAASRKPVAAELELRDGDETLARRRTDAEGWGTIEDPAPHANWVVVRASGYARKSVIPSTELVVLEKAAVVHGWVVDTSGNPVIGAAVAARDATDPSGERSSWAKS